MTVPTQRTKLTPNDIAKAWGIARETVVSWIRSGELAAINVAALSRQPRFRIDVEDLRAFELKRRVGQTSKASPRRTRADSQIPDFF